MKITIDLDEIEESGEELDLYYNLKDWIRSEVADVIRRTIKAAINSDENLKEAIKEIKRRTTLEIVTRLEEYKEDLKDEDSLRNWSLQGDKLGAQRSKHSES